MRHQPRHATVPSYETTSLSAVFSLKDLPKAIASRWNSEVTRIIQLPDVKEHMAATGYEPVGGSPERLREFVIRDIAEWRNVVKVVAAD